MKKWLKITLIALISAAVIALCVWLIPLVWSLREPENQVAFENLVGSLGFLGILLMLGIQVLQIVVAVIPGEPIELIMGLMYGTWGGLRADAHRHTHRLDDHLFLHEEIRDRLRVEVRRHERV